LKIEVVNRYKSKEVLEFLLNNGYKLYDIDVACSLRIKKLKVLASEDISGIQIHSSYQRYIIYRGVQQSYMSRLSTHTKHIYEIPCCLFVVDYNKSAVNYHDYLDYNSYIPLSYTEGASIDNQNTVLSCTLNILKFFDKVKPAHTSINISELNIDNNKFILNDKMITIDDEIYKYGGIFKID
jgi:hypothetical protein